MSSFTLGLLAAAAGSASAAVHTVMVGEGGLNFVPKSLTAAMGDQIEFMFVGGNHSVAEGSYDNACMPSGDDAFYSGFVPATMAMSPWTLTINSTDPIWYYCSQGDHCQDGMVGVINPPSSGASIDGYAMAASNADMNKSPETVMGGVFAAAMGSSDSSSSMMSSMMSSSSMSMSMSSSMDMSGSSMTMTMSTTDSASDAMMTATPTTGGAAQAMMTPFVGAVAAGVVAGVAGMDWM